MPSVLFVCLGNICRSPMAHALAVVRAQDEGRTDLVFDSAGTSSTHQGEPADRRTLEVLRRRSRVVPMVSRPVVPDDYQRFDWILAMDGSNLATLRRRAPGHAKDKVHRMLAPTTGGDVPDPYYGGADGFDHVHDLVADALDAWWPRWTDPS